MAYKIRLPADFGRKHIGCPAHGNLTLKLKDGQETKANSMIMSLNSPVIDDLTTDLLQTTLDMDDFSNEAVDSLIEACYTGEVQLTKELFRDLNKMANVFKIEWLSKNCYEYYSMLVGLINEDNYEDTCFAFEEAAYIRKTLKKQTFFDLITDKINTLDAGKESFISNYLQNISSRSIDELELVVEFAGSNPQLLADALVATLRTDDLDENSRHLLKKINFAVLRENHRPVYNELLNMLQNIENISVEDLRMIVRLQTVESPTTNEEQVQAAPNKDIPNISCSTKLVEFITLPFDEYLQKLIDSPDAKNLYMLIDGIWLWLFVNRDEEKTPTINEELLRKISAAKTHRNWKAITKQYLDKFPEMPDRFRVCNNFIDTLKECNDLVDEGDVLLESTEEFSIEELVVPNTKIKFHFRHPSIKSCTKEGQLQCGFMLNVTRDESGAFDIQLSTDPNEYPDDLHIHENLILAKNMHLALLSRPGYIVPLACGEQLECDETGNYWRWGGIRFYKEKDKDRCRWETDRPWGFYITENCKFLVVYQGQ